MTKKLNRPLQSAQEIITSTKLNRGFRGGWNAAAAAVFGLVGAPAASVFVGDACKAVPTSPAALAVDLSPGLALHDLASGDDYTSDFRPILLDVAQRVTFDANSSGLTRIDRVSVRAVEVQEDPQTVNIKDPLTGAINPAVRDQRVEYAYQYIVSQGVPDASPVAPATPSGYLAVCDVTIASGAGAINSSDIADQRTTDTLTAGSINTNTINTRATADPLAVLDSDGNQAPIIGRNTVKAFGQYIFNAVSGEFDLVSGSGYNMPASSVKFATGQFDFTFPDQSLVASNAALVFIQKEDYVWAAHVLDMVKGSVVSGANRFVRLYYFDASAAALADPNTAGVTSSAFNIMVLDATA